MNICFVGFGNIAQAIIGGLLKSGMSSENIACIERNQQKIALLKEKNLRMIQCIFSQLNRFSRVHIEHSSKGSP